MDNRLSPEISSFVLRFVQDDLENAPGQPVYRGFIQHVQTDERVSFTRWDDAVNFMSQFIPSEVFDQIDPTKAEE